MTAHLEWDVLNDYADGVLAADAQQQAARHIDSCAQCRDDLARLRAVLTAASAPASIEAPAGAWDGIEQRVERAKIVSLPGSAATAPRGSSRWRLVAAAIALVVASSAGTVFYMRAHAPQFVVALEPPAAAQQVVALPVDFARAEQGYIDTMRELVETLNASNSKLSPQTVQKVQKSLKVIDDAIIEARQALLADPANEVLRTMLAKRYQQKVDVLRRASERSLETENE